MRRGHAGGRLHASVHVQRCQKLTGHLPQDLRADPLAGQLRPYVAQFTVVDQPPRHSAVGRATRERVHRRLTDAASDRRRRARSDVRGGPSDVGVRFGQPGGRHVREQRTGPHTLQEGPGPVTAGQHAARPVHGDRRVRRAEVGSRSGASGTHRLRWGLHHEGPAQCGTQPPFVETLGPWGGHQCWPAALGCSMVITSVALLHCCHRATVALSRVRDNHVRPCAPTAPPLDKTCRAVKSTRRVPKTAETNQIRPTALAGSPLHLTHARWARPSQAGPTPSARATAHAARRSAPCSGSHHHRYHRPLRPPLAAGLITNPSSHTTSTMTAIHHKAFSAKPAPKRIRARRRTRSRGTIVITSWPTQCSHSAPANKMPPKDTAQDPMASMMFASPQSGQSEGST